MSSNKNSKSVKRIVRDLQELRGCSYTAALRELRELPEGTNWKDHVMRVALQEPPAEMSREAAVRAVASVRENMERDPAVQVSGEKSDE